MLGDLDAEEAEGGHFADELGVHVLGLIHGADDGGDLLGAEAADGVAEHQFVFA